MCKLVTAIVFLYIEWQCMALNANGNWLLLAVMIDISVMLMWGNNYSTRTLAICSCNCDNIISFWAVGGLWLCNHAWLMQLSESVFYTKMVQKIGILYSGIRLLLKYSARAVGATLPNSSDFSIYKALKFCSIVYDIVSPAAVDKYQISVPQWNLDHLTWLNFTIVAI